MSNLNGALCQRQEEEKRVKKVSTLLVNTNNLYIGLTMVYYALFFTMCIMLLIEVEYIKSCKYVMLLLCCKKEEGGFFVGERRGGETTMGRL